VAIRRSDHPHARILNIDISAAFSVPGVVAVFDAHDLDGVVRPVRAVSKMAHYHSTEIWPLARGKVRYVGEPVLAVVAESRYAAEDALEHITIDYEMLPFEGDAEQAAKPGAPLLHEETGTNAIVRREFKRGDVDAAFAAAAVTVAGRFQMLRKTAVAMENRCYLAEWDAGKGALTFYTASNIPGVIRDALCESLDLPGTKLRVIAPDVGGSFGGKGSLYQEELLIPALAMVLERPVKWTGDRLEDLAATSQAFGEVMDLELAVTADGLLLGLRARVTGDIGAYSIYPWTGAIEPVQVVSFLPGPYRLANYHGIVQGVMTPKAPTGPYRGVGRPAATFAMEGILDLAARKLGLDPAEIRRRNLVKAEEFPYRIGSGIIWDRSAFQEGLQAVCDAAGYDALRAWQTEARAAGRWVGIGLASYAELTGIGSRIAVAPGMPINTGTETAVIRIDSTGGITAGFGVASHGQGLETTLAQVVADELGCRFEDIQIQQGDSAAVPTGTGTYASRSAVLGGGAAIMSARVVKQKVLRAAAHLLEAAEVDLEASNGVVRVVGTDRTLTFKAIAKAVYSQMGRIPREKREDLEATETYDPYFGTAASATHLAVVEVDRDTYGVTVSRYIVAEDCGRIINPMIVDGQVHGAVAQGIGAALLEEIVYDADGQIVTASLADYLIPTASTIPPMSIVHLEVELPNTLGGFRGMGEGGTIGAPAAIANAVSDALSPLGLAVRTLPITPERIYQLVEHSKADRQTS
jgi:carbon-monoxide dehydrogenase large subunit